MSENAITVDVNKMVINALGDGVREAVKHRLTGSYNNNPLDKLIDSVIAEKSGEIKQLLSESLMSCLTDQNFRENIGTSVRAHMAKTLVARFGGELEKQVNVLKSDPSTRARITLAIEEIVKSQLQKA